MFKRKISFPVSLHVKFIVVDVHKQSAVMPNVEMGITCPHFNPLPMVGQGFSLSLHLWSYLVSFLALK